MNTDSAGSGDGRERPENGSRRPERTMSKELIVLNSIPGRGRGWKRPAALGLVGCLLLVSASLPGLAKLETWREEGATTLRKARREGLVVTDSGRVRLGQPLRPLGQLSVARVWDLARRADGSVFAATGDEGKVLRLAGANGSDWEVAFDASDSQVLCLAVSPDGKVVAGTGPSGQVVEVTDPKHPVSRPAGDVQYIWDLAFNTKGELFAATGPSGQLWKRSVEGAWSIVFDSRHSHLLCLAVGSDGAVYAGSDGDGLIYRVEPAGRVAVVYDSPQSEVRSILLAPDGSVIAGTAAESGGGSGRGPGSVPGNAFTSTADSSGSRSGTVASTGVPAQATPKGEPAKKEDRPGSASSGGGSALPRPLSAGENAVYRIDRDGVAREIFRAKALVFALGLQGDRVLIATGPEGQLFEVRTGDQESTPLARLDNGHLLSLLTVPGGDVLLGTADPGGVVKLESGHVATGTMTSEVRDTKLVSRFGALSWRAVEPKGTSVRVQVRSGNVQEPDATWSEWSTEQSDPSSGRALSPPGRFVQYRATLATQDPKVTPELQSVTLRYQTANLAPEITRLEVPDVSGMDGATRQTRLTLRWDVTDPNDDELDYTLSVRKDDWPGWISLNKDPLTEKTYSWDTTTLPSGQYRVKLEARDRPSNNPEDARSRERVSDWFLVDHDAPEVTVLKSSPTRVKVGLRDGLTRIVKSAYALDGGEWVPVFAEDGLFDTPNEVVDIALPELKHGTHILVVRVTDAAGNLGTGDTIVEVP